MTHAAGAIRSVIGAAAAPDALRWFARGLADGAVKDAQAGAFTMAVRLRGLSPAARTALTKGMRDSGDVLAWDLPGPVVDKHSTGGMGDCISLALAPALITDMSTPLAGVAGNALEVAAAVRFLPGEPNSDIRALTLAGVALGSGRRREGDRIDPRVGFTALAAPGDPGDPAGPGRPLGRVDAADVDSANAAASALRAACRTGPRGPLVQGRIA